MSDVFKLVTDDFSWEIDNFDSAILFRKVAKIKMVKTASSSITKLINSLKSNSINYAILRIPADSFSLIHLLEILGFNIVDSYIVLKRVISNELSVDKSIRLANESDIVHLQQISRNSFSNTRYFNDPIINNDMAKEIYATWIENSVKRNNSEHVLVWEDHKIAGYIAIKKDGTISLIAVDNGRYRQGIGTKLISGAFNVFSEWSLSESTVETQMTNINALRLYQKTGFIIKKSFVTLRWHS